MLIWITPGYAWISEDELEHGRLDMSAGHCDEFMQIFAQLAFSFPCRIAFDCASFSADSYAPFNPSRVAIFASFCRSMNLGAAVTARIPKITITTIRNYA